MGQLLEMAKVYEKTAGDKGFWSDEPKWGDFDAPQKCIEATKLYKAAKIALMHSELSEALEGVRKDAVDSHCPEFTSEEVELADAVIRILDYAYHYNLRLDEAMAAKSAYNNTRPYKHGKAF